MLLCLVQHGEARPKEEDPDRHLTARGRADVRRVAEFLAPLGLRVAAIWHSGKARAAETAELLGRAAIGKAGPAIRSDEGVVLHEGLSPDDDIGPIRKELERAEGDLMLVGHLPFLSRLASRLLAGDESVEVVAFQRGGVVCLERSADGRWRVAWALTPHLLASAKP